MHISCDMAPSDQLLPPFSSALCLIRADKAITVLPATYHDYRVGSSHKLRGLDSPSDFVRVDLDVSRLNRVHGHLWWAGRPTYCRALHRQRTMGREIVITEQADLHLVWHESRMFLKPLPDYLLDHRFWEDVICRDADLYGISSGFLLSYVWLLCNRSDLAMAMELRLLPWNIEWADWVAFVNAVLLHIDTDSLDTVNRRYHFGELRLNRLNQIHGLVHIFQPAQVIRGYFYGYNRYSTFFRRNFGWVLLIFIYMTIILTAIQVGLATVFLRDDHRFQQASYGFAVFSIVSPVAVTVFAALLFLYLFLNNVLMAWASVRRISQYRQERSRSSTGYGPGSLSL
jgi:hypothetical protein